MIDEVRGRKILWLSHLLPWPPKGGLQQRSYYLMREVSQYHQVEVVAFRQKAHQPSQELVSQAISAISKFANVRKVIELPEDVLPGGRNAMVLRSLLPSMPYTVRWGYSHEYGFEVQSAMQDYRPDVIHFDTVSLAPYSAYAGKVPCVLNHHNIESQMLLRRAEKDSNLLRKLYFLQEGKRLAKYERKLAGKFVSHLVCAELDGERLRNVAGQIRVRVVPNGVDLDYFKPRENNVYVEPRSLIFVGGLSWYPNASAIRFFLREAWPIISQKYPDIKLRVIGRRPPEDLVVLSSRDPRIELLGFVDDIRPIVHGSSVYVCPIYDGGGTKLKMLDAMAMGMPIVAHPVACEGLGLRHGEQVLTASTGLEFANELERIFADHELCARLSNSARSHVEQHFSFTSIGRDLAAYYGGL
jgi:polysaccharide biosynthesis protein PslH